MLIIKICFFVGSSSASAADVTVASPAQITFSVGDAPVGSPMMRCTSDFDIVDDSDQEGIEEFDIFIMSPTDCLGNPSFAQVNIQDNDNGVLPLLFCYSRNKAFFFAVKLCALCIQLDDRTDKH